MKTQSPNGMPATRFMMNLLCFGMSILLASILMTSCSTTANEMTCTMNEMAVGQGGQPQITAVPVLPATPFNYANIVLPAHFRTAINLPGQTSVVANDNTLRTNPITDNGATLGRVLFYERNLSLNRTVACASCHNQANSFSDTNRLSRGFAGGLTRRHSMNLANARYYQNGHFFWDERAATLEEQVLKPIQDATEMGLSLAQITQRINEQPYYANLYQRAFGTPEITADRTARALAQFVRSMVSTNSRYDQGRAQVRNTTDNFPNFTASENNGKRLFLLAPGAGGAGCAGCHTTDAQIATRPTNNGLDAISTTDLGVYETTKVQADIGKFKVPSLRDIAVTPPYMHDGRFRTLEQVVEHYNSGVQPHQNLDPRLRGQRGVPLRLNLTAQQKVDLVAFIRTLTDQSFTTDPKYSNPFRN